MANSPSTCSLPANVLEVHDGPAVLGRLEPLGAGGEPAARSLAPLAHEAGLEQDPQVLGDGLARDIEALGELTGGARVSSGTPRLSRLA